MVLVPALAYAIYQAGAASEPQEHAHARLRSIAAGDKNQPKPTEFTSETKARDVRQVRRADACIQDHAWDRLLSLLESAAGDELGGATMQGLAKECVRLLDNHLEHPHGSELWKELSRLSSTTPGANDLLVFETMSLLGHDAAKGPMRARLYCSRTRFEAIRSGYYDHAFREVLRGKADDIAGHILARQHEWGAADKLSKAFLLSRRCLIPSDSSVDDPLADQRELAGHVSKLLSDCRSGAGADRGIETLSSRYLAGFLSNPRFAKPAGFSPQHSERETDAYAAALSSSPKGGDTVLASLFRGRSEWVRMLMTDEHRRDTAAVFQSYGAASRALFDERHSESMDDSEAPVWLIPELICLVSLGEALVETEAYRAKLGKRIGEARGESLNLSRTIQKIGERHYGVYFNLPAEARRIRMGLLRMAELGKVTSTK